MSNSNYGVMNAMVDILTSPSRAWDEIREHTGWLWVPLILVILVTSAAFTYFYLWVDYDWFVEETIRSMPVETRAEAAPGVRQFHEPGFQHRVNRGGRGVHDRDNQPDPRSLLPAGQQDRQQRRDSLRPVVLPVRLVRLSGYFLGAGHLRGHPAGRFKPGRPDGALTPVPQRAVHSTPKQAMPGLPGRTRSTW